MEMSTEELNSNLDYFIDVDVSKFNDELLSTLIACGRQECDVERLKRLFEKLRFSDLEIKKYNLQEAYEKSRGEIRAKIIKKNVYEYDLEKICENYNQIKNSLSEIFERRII